MTIGSDFLKLSHQGITLPLGSALTCRILPFFPSSATVGDAIRAGLLKDLDFSKLPSMPSITRMVTPPAYEQIDPRRLDALIASLGPRQ